MFNQVVPEGSNETPHQRMRTFQLTWDVNANPPKYIPLGHDRGFEFDEVVEFGANHGEPVDVNGKGILMSATGIFYSKDMWNKVQAVSLNASSFLPLHERYSDCAGHKLTIRFGVLLAVDEDSFYHKPSFPVTAFPPDFVLGMRSL